MKNVVQIAVKVKDSASAGFKKINTATKEYNNSLKDLNGTASKFSSAMVKIAAAVGAAGLAKAFIDVNASAEKTRIMLKNIMQDSKKAAEAFTFIRNSAKEIPFSIDALQSAFVKLQVSGLKPMEGSLKTVADAVAAFGGSTQDFELATVAIQQMASKGVISMEELRQQLGERVPTAMKDMAQGLGMTMEEMNKAISAGKITAEQGLNAMLGVWKQKFDGMSKQMMSGFGGIVAQLKTAFSDIALTIGDAGLFDTIKQKISDVTNAIKEMIANGNMQQWANSISNTFKTIASVIGTVTAGFVKFIDVISPIAPLIGQLVLAFAGIKTALAVFNVLSGIRAEVLAFNAALKALAATEVETAMAQAAAEATSFGTSLAGLTGNIRTLINSMGLLGKSILIVGAAWGAWQIVKLVASIAELIYQTNRLKEAQSQLAQVQQTTGEKLAVLNERLGTSFTSVKELQQAVKEGSIVMSEATGQWELADQTLGNLSTTADTTKESISQIGDGASESANNVSAASEQMKTSLQSIGEQAQQTVEQIKQSFEALQTSIKSLQDGMDGTDLSIKVNEEDFNKAQAKIDELREKAGEDLVLNLKLDIWQQRLNQAREAYENQIVHGVEDNPPQADVDTSKAYSSWQAWYDDWLAGKATIEQEPIEIDVDTSQAEEKIDNLKSKVNDLNKKADSALDRMDSATYGDIHNPNRASGFTLSDVYEGSKAVYSKMSLDELRQHAPNRGGATFGVFGMKMDQQTFKAWQEEYNKKFAEAQKALYSSKQYISKQMAGYNRCMSVYKDPSKCKLWLTNVKKFATGGFIAGYGGGDKVPALLEQGEFVLRKEAAKKYGLNLVGMLNSMQVPKFSEGGAVETSAAKFLNVTFNVGDQSATGKFPTNSPIEQVILALARDKKVSVR